MEFCSLVFEPERHLTVGIGGRKEESVGQKTHVELPSSKSALDDGPAQLLAWSNTNCRDSSLSQVVFGGC